MQHQNYLDSLLHKSVYIIISFSNINAKFKRLNGFNILYCILTRSLVNFLMLILANLT
jgi:hypothetical protein